MSCNIKLRLESTALILFLSSGHTITCFVNGLPCHKTNPEAVGIQDLKRSQTVRLNPD